MVDQIEAYNQDFIDNEKIINLDTCVIYLDRYEIEKDGVTLPLTPIEQQLLDRLYSQAPRAVSQRDLLQAVWNYHPDIESRAVINTVFRLRRKIERDPSTPRHLLAIRGMGYRFAV